MLGRPVRSGATGWILVALKAVPALTCSIISCCLQRDMGELVLKRFLLLVQLLDTIVTQVGVGNCSRSAWQMSACCLGRVGPVAVARGRVGQ